jgi:hypothetical protein
MVSDPATRAAKIENICPKCGHFTDRAGHLTKDISPSKGDISFCWGCGEVSEFDETLKLVKFEETKLPLEDREELAEVRAAWKIIKMKGKKDV